MTVSPGWYDDPQAPGQQRYFDGVSWTEHRLPAASAVTPEPVAPQTAIPETAMPVAAVPPGWYPDPTGGQSYWDGANWRVGAWQPSGYLQGESSSFGGAIGAAFRHMFVFRGRASRSSFWWFYLFTSLVAIAIAIVWVALVFALAPASTTGYTSQDVAWTGGQTFVSLLAVLAYIAVAWPMVALGARRLHDRNWTGWFLLLWLVPYGSIGLLVMWALEGTRGPNKYDVANP